MIIACPSCSRKFQADTAAFSDPNGRKVRCGGCRHEWLQKPVADDPPSPEIVKQKKNEAPQPKESRGILSWVIFVIALCVILPSLLVLMRHHVVRQWPKTADIYRVVGLPVVVINNHFKFQGTTWGTVTEDGQDILKIKGTIVYSPEVDMARTVPPIKISVYDAGKCATQSWASKLLDGEDQYLKKGLCLRDRWFFKTTDDLAIPGEVIAFETEKPYDATQIDPKAVILEFSDNKL